MFGAAAGVRAGATATDQPSPAISFPRISLSGKKNGEALRSPNPAHPKQRAPRPTARPRGITTEGDGLQAASGTRQDSSLNPEVRSNARSSRTTVMSTAVRRSSTTTRARSSPSAPRSGSRETTLPMPRRIQLRTVERGISNSGNSSGFPALAICCLMRWSYVRREQVLMSSAEHARARQYRRAESQGKANDYAVCNCILTATECSAP